MAKNINIIGTVDRGVAPKLSGVTPVDYFSFNAQNITGDYTFSRSTDKVRINSDGQPEVIAADVLPYDWSSGRCAIALEASRTNHVERSSHTSSFPWNTDTTHLGIRATLIDSGEELGVPYADYRLTGRATSTNSRPFVSDGYSLTAITPTVGDFWAASVYVKMINGDMPSGVYISASVTEVDSSFNHLRGTSVSDVMPSDELQRAVVVKEIFGPDTARVRSSVIINGLVAGDTEFNGQVVRVFGWQLEKANMATSLVQTLADAPETCAGDHLDMINLTSYAGGMTVICRGRIEATSGLYNRVLQFDSGVGTTSAHRVMYFAPDGEIQAKVLSGGTVQATGDFPYDIGDEFAIGYAAGSNAFLSWLKGYDGAMPTDVSVTYDAPDRLSVGEADVDGDHQCLRLLLTDLHIWPAITAAIPLQNAVESRDFTYGVIKDK